MRYLKTVTQQPQPGSQGIEYQANLRNPALKSSYTLNTYYKTKSFWSIILIITTFVGDAHPGFNQLLA